MVHIDYLVRTLDDTARLAEQISQAFPRPLILALTGELGSGKTAFVQTLARGLGVEGNVQSPTFTLVNEYPLKDGVLIHADLYRTKDSWEIAQLGLSELFNLPSCIAAVEWANRASEIFPINTVWLDFILTESHRVIRITQKNDAINHYLPIGKL